MSLIANKLNFLLDTKETWYDADWIPVTKEITTVKLTKSNLECNPNHLTLEIPLANKLKRYDNIRSNIPGHAKG